MRKTTLQGLARQLNLPLALVADMAAMALHSGAYSDLHGCPHCRRLVVVTPKDFGHLAPAITAVHGTGEDTACPHCGKELFPDLKGR